MTYWTDAELAEMAYKLEDYHRVFNVFWSLASISWTDDSAYCPTAMVNLKHKPRITVNKPWWNALSPTTQVFVIVHECLHVLLNHGFRNGKAEVPHATFTQVNKAQDITINELAESLFGIPRTQIDSWQQYCWVVTCFPNDTTILHNETFVYYLKKLATQPLNDELKLLDSHASDGDELDDEMRDEDDSLDELYDALTQEELEALAKAASHGRGTGDGFGGYLERKAVKEKLHVAKLVKGFKASARAKQKTADTFVLPNRRYSALPAELILPSEHNNKQGLNKFKIALCLDVSGSVIHLRPKFFGLRELFLKEKNLLEVRSYIFADRIKEIDDKTIKYDVGGGNDPFQIIEREITKPLIKGSSKIAQPYPDCVIVITDGYAGKVTPKHPKRWLWLVTDEHTTESIPKESKIVKMSDVIFD